MVNVYIYHGGHVDFIVSETVVLYGHLQLMYKLFRQLPCNDLIGQNVTTIVQME